MKRPTPLPTLAPGVITGGRVPLAVRWRNFRRDLAALITKAAAFVAGH